MANDQGWMTSVAYSPTLGTSIGLGFIKSGDTRIGEIVRAVSPVHDTEMDVEICSAHFIDPEGERLRA
jgi:sarcosine oxidase subunit alpha